MKKYLIALISILCLCFMVSCFTCNVNAADTMTLDDLNNPDAYTQGGGNDGRLLRIGNVIVFLVRVIGESIAVIMLLVIGIKYIMGSVTEKAEYKQTMWPYIAGAILIFTGSAFVDIIYRMFQG